MATPPTHNLIKLFTAEEYDDLYGFPHLATKNALDFLHYLYMIAN